MINRLDDDERAFLDTYIEELKPRTAKERFNLGMFISYRFLRPGQCRDRTKLGAFCGVSRQAIELTELRALRKLRRGSLLLVAREYLNGAMGHGVQ